MVTLKRILLWIAAIIVGGLTFIFFTALFQENGQYSIPYVAVLGVVLFFIIRALRKPHARKQAQQTVASGWDGGKDEYLIKVAAAANNLIRNAPRPIPGLGYYNMPKFSVSGVNSSTNRRKTLHIRARHVDAARSAGKAQGLIEPITVEVELFKAATGRSDYGYSIPAGACEDDAFELENSASSCDGNPTPAYFITFLTEAGIPCSRIAGRNSAMKKLLNTLDLNEKAELFGYAVDCSLHNKPLNDIPSALESNRFKSFAEAIGKDAVAIKSLIERSPEDFWSPSQRSAAYKFAIDYLGGHMQPSVYSTPEPQNAPVSTTPVVEEKTEPQPQVIVREVYIREPQPEAKPEPQKKKSWLDSLPETEWERRRNRIAENKKNGVACCPKCGSTSLSVNKKGYSFVKGFLLTPLGGTIGMNKIKVTCLNCGYKFKPGR